MLDAENIVDSEKRQAKQWLLDRGITVAMAGNLARCLEIKDVEDALFGYFKFSRGLFLQNMVPKDAPLSHEKYMEHYSLVKAYQYIENDIKEICRVYQVAEMGVSDDEAGEL